ncbi:putative glutamate receptor [Portunus trituberculatus]|uniref:Putative glutamate receptor n=1 Tax=Portunus trituberculatus TaxID=210409 RepID=A0A5B7DX96_PORTR|nr:putative glutamate receptor [Portunus trituberculatus]
MVAAVKYLAVVVMLADCLHCALLPGNQEYVSLRSAAAVLRKHAACAYTALLISDGRQGRETMEAPRGVTVFHAAADHRGGNATQKGVRQTVDKMRQLGAAWHCLVVVVVSDDPAFLAAFAHLSLRRHALRWFTRILVLTRLPLSHLGRLHGLLSNRNAMLLHVQESEEAVRFTTPPTLTVAVEFLPYHTLTWVEDPREPGGRRLLLTGFVDEIVKYLARAMNFRYRYVVSPDGTFGTRLPDGSWTGLMGMVVREEADFAPGPFIINPQRYEAAQAAAPYSGSNIRILGGLKGLEMDPWGFLFPLTPLVWTVTLVMLVGVHFVLQVLPSCLLGKRLCSEAWLMDPSHSMRVLLQQDVVWPAQWLWWERLLLGLWMLTTLVLTKSYAGNLMSLLAVRYVPQPFQTIHDVLDHPSVSVISQKHSSYEQTLMDVKSGVLRKVADLQQEGRLEFHTLKQLPRSIDTLVRGGTHVHVGLDINLRSQIALDFSKNGTAPAWASVQLCTSN